MNDFIKKYVKKLNIKNNYNLTSKQIDHVVESILQYINPTIEELALEFIEDIKWRESKKEEENWSSSFLYFSTLHKIAVWRNV